MKNTKINFAQLLSNFNSKIDNLDSSDCSYNYAGMSLVEANDNIDAIAKTIYNYVYDYSIVGTINAKQYLVENDPTLRSSLNIARGFGLRIENLNNEILGTLHIQDKMLRQANAYIAKLKEKLTFYVENGETL